MRGRVRPRCTGPMDSTDSATGHQPRRGRAHPSPPDGGASATTVVTAWHTRVIDHGERRPYRIALRHDGSGCTYGVLARRSRCAAAVLAECGVRPGDRVAAAGSEGPRFLEILLGCGILGAVFVPLDDGWNPATVRAVLVDSAAALLVGSAPAALVGPTEVLTARDFDRGIIRSRPAPMPGASPAGQPALLDYTATAGPAITADTLTHGALLAAAQQRCADTGLSARDSTLPGAPLARVASREAMVFAALLAGARLVLPVSTDPVAVATLVAEEAVTVRTVETPLDRAWGKLGVHRRPDVRRALLR